MEEKKRFAQVKNFISKQQSLLFRLTNELPASSKDGPTLFTNHYIISFTDYESNKKQLNLYISKNQLKIQEEFNLRVIEEKLIGIQDVLPFFEAIFHMEGVEGLFILENKQDCFQSTEIYKKLFKVCSEFLANRRGFGKASKMLKN